MDASLREKVGKSALTNDPTKILSRATNGLAYKRDRRRWFDLVNFYSDRVGPEHMKHEPTRLKVIVLANLSLEIERRTSGLVAGKDGRLLEKRDYDSRGVPHTLVYERGNPQLFISIVQQVSILLKDLGLDEKPPKPISLEFGA